jgi:dipeptidyl aminopeptidase/acylaminoacyl peptidase
MLKCASISPPGGAILKKIACVILMIGILLSGRLPAAARQGEAAPNGTIESLELLFTSDSAEYYRMVYWSDGLRVTGMLGRPKANGFYPAIIYNRGGVWDSGSLTGYELIPLVECGYVVVGSNYRGNAGGEGGDQFGGADLNDVLNLIPLLRQLPYVDTSRIGMMGASRGGMMTYMVLKWQTDNGRSDIKSAVTVGGIADLYMWIDERPALMHDLFLPVFGKTPEEAPNLYQERSAVYWPEKINVPLLILHGEDDQEVSVKESRKLDELLTQYNKPHLLCALYAGDHGLTQYQGGYPLALDWFARSFAGPNEDLSYEGHAGAIDAVYEWFYAEYMQPK